MKRNVGRSGDCSNVVVRYEDHARVRAEHLTQLAAAQRVDSSTGRILSARGGDDRFRPAPKGNGQFVRVQSALVNPNRLGSQPKRPDEVVNARPARVLDGN